MSAAGSQSGPLVTVIIPTRNRPQLLQETIESVLAQTHPALEVLICDDGSTPPAQLNLADSRVRYLRSETSEGVANARNRGFAAATGEYIAFLDDDDLWAPDKIERQLRTLEASQAQWVYTGSFNFDSETGEILDCTLGPEAAETARKLPTKNMIPAGCSGVLVQRSLVESVGGFDTKLSQIADWDLWIRLNERAAPARLASLSVAYRLHKNNMSLDLDLTLSELSYLEQKHRRQVDRAHLLRWAGGNAVRQGDRRTALRAYFAAARLGRQRLSFVRGMVAFILPSLTDSWLRKKRRGPRVEWFDSMASNGRI